MSHYGMGAGMLLSPLQSTTLPQNLLRGKADKILGRDGVRRPFLVWPGSHEKWKMRIPQRHGIRAEKQSWSVPSQRRGLRDKNRGQGSKTDELGNSSYLHILGLLGRRKKKSTQNNRNLIYCTLPNLSKALSLKQPQSATQRGSKEGPRRINLYDFLLWEADKEIWLGMGRAVCIKKEATFLPQTFLRLGKGQFTFGGGYATIFHLACFCGSQK